MRPREIGSPPLQRTRSRATFPIGVQAAGRSFASYRKECDKWTFCAKYPYLFLDSFKKIENSKYLYWRCYYTKRAQKNSELQLPPPFSTRLNPRCPRPPEIYEDSPQNRRPAGDQLQEKFHGAPRRLIGPEAAGNHSEA